MNPAWNDDEKANYLRLVKGGTIEGLAYTAVQEMHNARIAHEKARERENSIVAALKRMSLGIVQLEDMLGVKIENLALECVDDELAVLREAKGGAK